MNTGLEEIVCRNNCWKQEITPNRFWVLNPLIITRIFADVKPDRRFFFSPLPSVGFVYNYIYIADTKSELIVVITFPSRARPIRNCVHRGCEARVDPVYRYFYNKQSTCNYHLSSFAYVQPLENHPVEQLRKPTKITLTRKRRDDRVTVSNPCKKPRVKTRTIIHLRLIHLVTMKFTILAMQKFVESFNFDAP